MQIFDEEPVVVVEEPVVVVEEPSSNEFTLEDLATHGNELDCYSAISNVVYDLTAWINEHPGGDRRILRICGIDGTSSYNGEHRNDNQANNILEGFEVGVLIS